MTVVAPSHERATLTHTPANVVEVALTPGDFTYQKFLGSMEGAVLSGKLAAEVVSDKAAGRSCKPVKEVVAQYLQEV